MNKQKITLVLACAGKGSRANLSYNKIFAKIDGEAVITKTFSAFNQAKKIDEIIIVYSKGEKELIKELLPPTDKTVKFVEGGETRFLSVKNALDTVDDGVVLIHDGARPYINKESIDAIIKSVLICGSGVACTPLTDTIVETDGNDNILSSSRKNKFSATTPQAFKVAELKRAYSLAKDGDGFTDDAGVYTAFIGKCKLVEVNKDNIKLTYESDFNRPTPKRVGTGFDLHKLVPDRKLILGGIEIPHDKGLLGHSDADVLTHAIMDALLSSASLRDIGYHFSDKDAKYKDISSMLLLERVMEMLRRKGLKPINVSAVVMAEKPKLSKFVPEITKSLATAMQMDINDIGITLTTLEGIGTVGREEGIATQAYVMVGEI